MGKEAVSMESGLDGRNNELEDLKGVVVSHGVSMESGLDGRNNVPPAVPRSVIAPVSQWSPA